MKEGMSNKAAKSKETTIIIKGPVKIQMTKTKEEVVLTVTKKRKGKQGDL